MNAVSKQAENQQNIKQKVSNNENTNNRCGNFAMPILLQHVVQQRGNGVIIVIEITILRECEDKRKVRSQDIRRVCMKLISSVTQSPMKGVHVLNEKQIGTPSI